MITALPRASAVVDEPPHLAAGMLAFQRGDLTVNREHPPLMKWLAGGAAATLHPTFPPEPADVPRASSDFAFVYGRELLYKANDADALLRRARLPIVAATLAAGAVLFFWGWRLMGPWPAAAALALFAFEPNLLAHGRLVTTDMGAALFTLATLACLERAQQGGAGAPRSGKAAAWGRDVAAGAMLGLALLTRFSCVLLIPVGMACLVFDRRRPARSRWLGGAIALAVALLVLQAGYGAIAGSEAMDLFPLSASATGEPLRAQPLAAMESSGALRWLPLPLPRLWLEGMDLARWKNAHLEGPSYLDGRISADGFWSYFVAALLMKGTLPWLLLAAAGVGAIAWRARAAAGVSWTPLLIWCTLPAGLLLSLTTALTRAQIGLRYVLPVIPLLCLAGGAVVARRAPAPRRPAIAAMVLTGSLLAWHAWSALAIHPFHLAYFNEAAGGPEAGARRLVDSNLDWGQDLIGLARFLEERRIDQVNLYYFGTADPDYYRIRRAPAAQPGWFAVSATHLAGVYLPDPGYLAPFRSLRPDAAIGHSILLYHLDQVPPRLTQPIRRP